MDITWGLGVRTPGFWFLLCTEASELFTEHQCDQVTGLLNTLRWLPIAFKVKD